MFCRDQPNDQNREVKMSLLTKNKTKNINSVSLRFLYIGIHLQIILSLDL